MNILTMNDVYQFLERHDWPARVLVNGKDYAELQGFIGPEKENVKWVMGTAFIRHMPVDVKPLDMTKGLRDAAN